jgi:pimeloyl-ACP methyl ester carboxylesterase
MHNMQPFTIDVSQDILDDLSRKLKTTILPDQGSNRGWYAGTNIEYMSNLLDYWRSGYNWRKQEAELNRHHQYTTEIDGVTIHFIHEKGKGPDPKPLILTHGWPDSFYRFHKVIPLLTDPASHGGDPAHSFDVIIPSMPGFGFSSHTPMASSRVADLWAKLMTDVLGYQKFGAAGGDLGTGVTRDLAVKYPDLVTAIHLTDTGYPIGVEDMSSASAELKKFLADCQHWWMTEGAYIMMQSSKPQTLAYSLQDSPVGLAAWVTEKFFAWSDNKGDLDNSFTRDELLTHIMIYWVTGTIGSAIYTYAENARAVFMQPGGPKPPAKVTAPTAVASFPKDAVPVVRDWAAMNVNVQQFTKMPAGGHFGAWEEPALYSRDISSFFYSTNP